MNTIIYTHGESEGNPGPATASIEITNESGEVLEEVKESIGNSTEVYAEYHAVLLGLQKSLEKYDNKTSGMKFEIKTKNESVKKQLNSEETVTDPGLVPMFMEIHNLRVANFPNLTLTHVK